MSATRIGSFLIEKTDTKLTLQKAPVKLWERLGGFTYPLLIAAYIVMATVWYVSDSRPGSGLAIFAAALIVVGMVVLFALALLSRGKFPTFELDRTDGSLRRDLTRIASLSDISEVALEKQRGWLCIVARRHPHEPIQMLPAETVSEAYVIIREISIFVGIAYDDKQEQAAHMDLATDSRLDYSNDLLQISPDAGAGMLRVNNWTAFCMALGFFSLMVGLWFTWDTITGKGQSRNSATILMGVALFCGWMVWQAFQIRKKRLDWILFDLRIGRIMQETRVLAHSAAVSCVVVRPVSRYIFGCSLTLMSGERVPICEGNDVYRVQAVARRIADHLGVALRSELTNGNA